MGVYLVCNGTVTFVDSGRAAGAPLCSTGWVQVFYNPPFDPTSIDPVTASTLFAAGFLLFVTPWATAWGFSQLLKLLR
jgi:hypothetical protein